MRKKTLTRIGAYEDEDKDKDNDKDKNTGRDRQRKIQIAQTYWDDPNKEECVEDEDDQHWSLHLPGLNRLLLHEEAVDAFMAVRVILVEEKMKTLKVLDKITTCW